MRSAVVSTIVVLAVSVGVSFSQSPREEKAVKHRLPNGYSKLGLRESQKNSIYAVQDKYAEQIDSLLKQLEDVRKQRDAEIEAVLTDEQRAELKQLTEQAAQRKKSAKSDKPVAAKTDAAEQKSEK